MDEVAERELIAEARRVLSELRQFSEAETDEIGAEAFDFIEPMIGPLGLDVESREWRDTILTVAMLAEDALQSGAIRPGTNEWNLVMGLRIMLLYLAFWPEYRPLPA